MPRLARVYSSTTSGGPTSTLTLYVAAKTYNRLMTVTLQNGDTTSADAHIPTAEIDCIGVHP